MAYNVSDAQAYVILFCVLVGFTALAVGSTGLLDFLPSGLTRLLTLHSTHDKARTTDYFLSARSSASSTSIALSFFASGMGAWVVYGTTEMGANPQLSWLGVLGYSSASSFPAIIICWLGPKVRNYMSEEKAFCTTDFSRDRYGRIMQLATAVISVFYMFIFIVAELTSISNIFGLLTNDMSDSFSNIVTISIGAFTIFYTSLAGLPASIVTDRFQGVIMGFLVLMLTIAVCAFDENQVSREEYKLASNWTTDGLMAFVTLILAILSAELFNQSTWQRVWAAEDDKALRRGFAVGSFMVFLLMAFFGIMGMLAYANDPTAYDNFEKYYYLAFFDLLEPLQPGWHIMVLIFVTALAASSIDSLQNGITCIFSADLVKVGWHPKWIARALLVVVNIPAIYMASIKYEVISLFLVADLVCATSVLPVFLGLQTKDFGILKAPTEFGAFSGCIAGIITVLVNGAVNDTEGGLFEYFWLKNEAICSLCGSKTMISFIVTPIVSGFITYLFSFLDIMVRGERAREPLIPVAFDKTEDEPMQEDDVDVDEVEAPGDTKGENGGQNIAEENEKGEYTA